MANPNNDRPPCQAAADRAVADAKREAIIRAGMACHGRVGEMARQLGIGRTTLRREMKRLNVSAADFTQSASESMRPAEPRPIDAACSKKKHHPRKSVSLINIFDPLIEPAN